MSGLVQLGSDLFLLAEDVVKIYQTEPVIIAGVIESPGYVYVTSRTYSVMGPTDMYRTSDWPMERVMAALGLTDAAALEQMWEQS